MFRKVLFAGVLGASALVMTGPTQLEAQATCGATGATPSCSLTGGAVTVSTTVENIVFISLANPTATLTAPDDGAFAGGGTTQVEDLALQTATIRSNSTWDLTLQGAAWTAPWAKPIGDIEWTTSGGTSWAAVTGSAVEIGTGAATSGDDVVLGYRTSWDLEEDVAGDYSMSLTLALSAP